MAEPFLTAHRGRLETARRAHEKGLEVLLHLPLESLNGNGSESDTEGLIRSGMSEEEVRSLLARELDRLPHVRGVNNHMGSSLTQDREKMRTVLETLSRHGLLFDDSRTSGKSVAFEEARHMRVPSLVRDVFVDGESEEMTLLNFRHLLALAKKNGTALGIGHPKEETLAVILRRLPELLKQSGVTMVRPSELIVP